MPSTISRCAPQLRAAKCRQTACNNLSGISTPSFPPLPRIVTCRCFNTLRSAQEAINTKRKVTLAYRQLQLGWCGFIVCGGRVWDYLKVIVVLGCFMKKSSQSSTQSPQHLGYVKIVEKDPRPNPFNTYNTTIRPMRPRRMTKLALHQIIPSGMSTTSLPSLRLVQNFESPLGKPGIVSFNALIDLI